MVPIAPVGQDVDTGDESSDAGVLHIGDADDFAIVLLGVMPVRVVRRGQRDIEVGARDVSPDDDMEIMFIGVRVEASIGIQRFPLQG